MSRKDDNIKDKITEEQLIRAACMILAVFNNFGSKASVHTLESDANGIREYIMDGDVE